MAEQEVSENIFLKNDLSEIERLAKAVAEFGKTNNLSDDVIYDLRLVLEEVVANIIQYGFEDDHQHQIAIQMHLQGEFLTVEINDDGKPFNPLEFKSDNIEKPLDEREEGGMGIYIVRELMDEIEYKRIEDHNVLLLRRYITDRL